jgi:hypothetical protein
MNKLEQAARQALEALIKANHFHDYEDEIAALREALAQPQENTARCGGCNKTAKDGWALYCVECWEKAQPQGKWVDLTDDDKSMLLVDYMGPHALTGETMNLLTAFNLGVEQGIAKFKEKNTPPVVPQGEPVAGSPSWEAFDIAIQAAIEATKEKAAKLIDSLYKHDRKSSGYDEGWNDALDIAEQAIRSMK